MNTAAVSPFQRPTQCKRTMLRPTRMILAGLWSAHTARNDEQPGLVRTESAVDAD